MIMMDKGLEILKKNFWNKGWTADNCTREEFETAKREGYMFDYPEHVSHDDVMDRIHHTLKKITPEMAANAFLYSLSTRKLEYRSVLGSYWYAVSIPEHKSTDNGRCDYCGWYEWKKEPAEYDLQYGVNVFNFERYKWGGVRHTKLAYALFDLEQFLKLPKVNHTQEDEKLLSDILHCADELKPHNKAGALQKLITGKRIIKSNKSEIEILLNILGICGVLSSDSAPCYAVSFCDEYDRAPLEFTNDYAYPMNRWRAADGINKERYRIVFGKEYI